MAFLRHVLLLCLALFGIMSVGEDDARAQPPTLSCTPPATDPEIAALARALNYDLSQIYEYIYYNVELLPTYGSKKGALGTYLDGSGNNFDLNVLFVTLLRQSCITANYRHDTVNFPAETVANLFGVENDVHAFKEVLSASAIPACIQITTGTCVESGSGPAANVAMSRVWTEATVETETYQLDPSFKSYGKYVPINVDAAMGYDRSTFVSQALSGSSSVPGLPAGINSIRNLNRTNITDQLNSYSENLASHIRTNNPSSSAKQLFGGREVTNENFGLLFPATGDLHTDLPVSFETVFTVTVSDNPDGSNPTISTTLYGSQIAGRRLTLIYDGTTPVLALEGTILATGTATSANQQAVSLTVDNPYAANANHVTHTARPGVDVGGTYAIMLHPGEMGRDTVTRHQKAAQKLINEGDDLDSEPVRGEYLAALGSSYISQSTRAKQLVSSLSNHVWATHTVMGIAGFSGTAAYVDFPAQLSGMADVSPANPPDAWRAAGLTVSLYNSTLESTAVEQFQKNEAVSTVRMFDYANSDGTGFIQATPTNWASAQDQLTGWSTSDKAAMGDWLASNPSSQVIVPLNGARTVVNWKGSGFYEMATPSGAQSVGYIISGGYSGGYGAGFDVVDGIAQTPGGLGTFTIDSFGNGFGWVGGARYSFQNGFVTCVFNCGLSIYQPTYQFALPPPVSFEPINLLSGSYLYDHEDMSVGSADYPFDLTLKRSYDSADRLQEGHLGYGWRHNFMMSAGIDSDSFEAFGDHNPLAAVPTVVAAHVIFDLMSAATPPSLDNTVISSLSASWLMDQLVRNVVTISTDGGTKRFTKIPTADGTGEYVPPPGDASMLVVNPDNSITVTDTSKTVLTFDADGKISSWKDANNNTVTFTYTGTEGDKLLQSVTNGIGRSLMFTYNGSDQLTSVSDGTRSVSYTYDTDGNLATYTDSSPTPAETKYVYDQPGRLTQIFYPSFPSTPFMTNTYDDFGRVETQADAFGNVWHYLFADGTRSQEIDPDNGSHVLYYDGKGNQTLDIDQAGDTTTMIYDGIGRLTKTISVNGDSVELAYDARHNVLNKTTNPVPGVTDPLTGQPATPITESWTYDTNFNRILTAKDGLGNITTNEYDANGNLLKVTRPAVAKPGVATPENPVSTFTYGARGLVATATDAEGRVTSYAYDPATFDLLSITRDSGAGRLNLKTSYAYDAVGNKIAVTDPNGNTSTMDYDGMRRVVQVTAPPPFTSTVTKFTYDPDGRRTSVAQATGVPATPWLTATTSYNAVGKPTTVTAADGTTTTTDYDVVGRVKSVTSSSGRRVSYTYDAASRKTLVVDGVSGTLDPSITVDLGSVVREMYTYFPGGLLAVSRDNKLNETKYSYDGFNRLKTIIYPDDTPTNPDFELYGYDANGNKLATQTRSGAQIWSTYDALNRKLTKEPTGQATITYGYDYTGRLLTAKASTDSAAHEVSYDSAGRRIGEFSPEFGFTTATLDANGNMTALAWPTVPDSYFASFTYDELNRLTGIYQNTPTLGPRIAGYSYNTLSQRTSLSYGPATAPVASTALTYTPAGQVASLAHTWNGSALTLDYTYNQDHQRTGGTASDATFLPSGLAPDSVTYTSNSLNQYTDVSGTSYTYDKNGNLISDGVWTYAYNTENQLISATNGSTEVTYSYDPFGRRTSQTLNGSPFYTWTHFNDREIAAFRGASPSFTAQRYIHGPGVDEVVASIGPTDQPTYYFQDALGSVIATANSSGLLTKKFTYTTYGQKSPLDIETIHGFTGRTLDPFTGLYHYRARDYSPTLGRFLQADPIGTSGGINLYAYVGNDPVNMTDPSGLAGIIFSLGGSFSHGSEFDPSNFVSLSGGVGAFVDTEGTVTAGLSVTFGSAGETELCSLGGPCRPGSWDYPSQTPYIRGLSILGKGYSLSYTTANNNEDLRGVSSVSEYNLLIFQVLKATGTNASGRTVNTYTLSTCLFCLGYAEYDVDTIASPSIPITTPAYGATNPITSSVHGTTGSSRK